MKTANRWLHLETALAGVGVAGLDGSAGGGDLVLETPDWTIIIADTWSAKKADLWTGWRVSFYSDEQRSWEPMRRPEAVASLVETIASGKLEATS